MRMEKGKLEKEKEAGIKEGKSTGRCSRRAGELTTARDLPAVPQLPHCGGYSHEPVVSSPTQWKDHSPQVGAVRDRVTLGQVCDFRIRSGTLLASSGLPYRVEIQNLL